jgi:hypothetical protein
MSVEIYRCFIASPGDTSEEREVCDEVFSEINSTLGQQLDFRIESKKWETNARPSFGEDGQAVINEQLLNNFQIFIGIMWHRFGTPTNRAESGTEEEFDLAHKLYLEEGNVEIMMYFNEAMAKVSDLDLEQLMKVKSFKDKVSSLGGLYWTYSGKNEFQQELKRHLNDYFINKLSSKTNDPNIKTRAIEIDNRILGESVSIVLKTRLNESLCLFSNQPTTWVDPVLSKTNDISKNADDNFETKVDLEVILSNPKSIIVKAPPQFGLTCLAHHFVHEAWKNRKLWVYVDSRVAKKHTAKKYIEKDLRNLNLSDRRIDCIVLDSWVSSESGSMKLLKNICKEYKDIPILVMQTIDDIAFQNGDSEVSINREFKSLHLLALPRNQIRQVVCNYNDEKNLGDENTILDKVIRDLDALNIHRTPLNCITLLKVSENNFGESPVNRTKMIEMILFVLFNLDELPTYNVRPDLKDCEYVLGRFCEILIRERNIRFTREQFTSDLTQYCLEKLLKLEVSIVFDTLFRNNIIMSLDSEFVFRSSYWIYYFAAKRMYSDKNFCEYIFSNQSYVSFPEIIEFYSGIDRERSELLTMLTGDLSKTRNAVAEKTGLPDDLDPLTNAEWRPTQESILGMQNAIQEDVLNSKLPDVIKDRYADKSYNQKKPYDQSLQSFMHHYLFTILIQKIRASSRALRNSDYVDPEVKRGLLREITLGWKMVSQVLFALAPLLAEKGSASFEGQGFTLDGDFGDTIEKRISAIYQANPINVVNLFRHDLYSNKLGPLIYDGIDSEKDFLIKHQLVLLLISERPVDWRKNVEKYITSISKNSYYLNDIVNALTNVYKFAFASDQELSEIRHLLKTGFAKHEFGIRKPSQFDLKKISDNVIPDRKNQ